MDIVERLRDAADMPKSMVMTDTAMREAAAEITRLRAQRDELVEALTPFADLARQIERDHLGWYHEHFQFIDPPIAMQWLITARAAMEEAKR